MRYVPVRLQELVVERAGNRCEYCGLAQAGQAATFHIDHVIPIAAGGETTADNLALACVACSLYKGARLTASDPEAGREVPIFNPRREAWGDHFRWEGVRVLGVTAIGRATTVVLQMNRPTEPSHDPGDPRRGGNVWSSPSSLIQCLPVTNNLGTLGRRILGSARPSEPGGGRRWGGGAK